jgi:hypothetical protein
MCGSLRPPTELKKIFDGDTGSYSFDPISLSVERTKSCARRLDACKYYYNRRLWRVISGALESLVSLVKSL